MKDYLDLTELRRPADCGQHHLMGWGRMNRKEKVNCFARFPGPAVQSYLS